MENNWKLTTIVVEVSDIDKAVEYYQAIGIGPFSPEFIIDRSQLYQDLKVSRPEDLTAKIKSRTAQLDKIRLELTQPAEGDSFQKRFLDAKGEGVIQMGFAVDDIVTETAKMAEKGFPVLVSGTREMGSIAIFDTPKAGGIYIELVQHKKQTQVQE